MVSNTARYGLDRSNVAHLTCPSHSSPWEASQAAGSVPPRPGTTSNRTPRVTSTMEVDQLPSPHPDPGEQRLVHPQRRHLADPVYVGVEEGFSVGEDGVVDGMPVTAQ